MDWHRKSATDLRGVAGLRVHDAQGAHLKTVDMGEMRLTHISDIG